MDFWYLLYDIVVRDHLRYAALSAARTEAIRSRKTLCVVVYFESAPLSLPRICHFQPFRLMCQCVGRLADQRANKNRTAVARDKVREEAGSTVEAARYRHVPGVRQTVACFDR